MEAGPSLVKLWRLWSVQAPLRKYNRKWHLTEPVRTHKAQLQAMHGSKQTDLERAFEAKPKVLSN